MSNFHIPNITNMLFIGWEGGVAGFTNRLRFKHPSRHRRRPDQEQITLLVNPLHYKYFVDLQPTLNDYPSYHDRCIT